MHIRESFGTAITFSHQKSSLRRGNPRLSIQSPNLNKSLIFNTHVLKEKKDFLSIVEGDMLPTAIKTS